MNEYVDLTYYQRNWDIILPRAKDYYENNKERLREQAKNKYRNLPKEEKNKKREYRKSGYLNMSEKKEKKTKRISKKLSWSKKNLNIIINKIVFNCKFNSFLIKI